MTTLPTYDLISTVTLAASTPSVVISGIPQGYRDLVLVSTNSMTATDSLFVRFNNNTTGYTAVRIFQSGGNNGTPVSDTYAPAEIGYNTTANMGIVNIMDYSVTNKHKTYFTRWGNANGTKYVQFYAACWANTEAIHTINLSPSIHQIAAGSTFALYGIVA